VGEIAALLAAMTWSATSVALTSLGARTAPVVLSALRLSAATLILPFILLASGQFGDLEEASTRTLLEVMASGVVGYGLGDTIYIFALQRVGMQRTFPITTALFIGMTVAGGVVLLGEPFSWGLPVGTVLVGAGIYLIVIPAAGEAPQPLPAVPAAEPALAAFGELPSPRVISRPTLSGYVLLILVGVFWAIATLWLAAANGDLGAIAAGSIRTPAGGAALLLYALALQRPQLAAPFRNRGHIAAIAAAGLLGTAFGSLLYVYSVTELGAARSAVFSATAPLMALPLSIIFLKERMTRRIGVGTVLCVGGVVLLVVG
jgi:drug/metabolite transporter (DMT)-like permease